MDDQRGENPNGIWHFLCPNHTDSISEMETLTCAKLVLCNQVKQQIQISLQDIHCRQLDIHSTIEDIVKARRGYGYMKVIIS